MRVSIAIEIEVALCNIVISVHIDTTYATRCQFIDCTIFHIIDQGTRDLSIHLSIVFIYLFLSLEQSIRLEYIKSIQWLAFHDGVDAPVDGSLPFI